MDNINFNDNNDNNDNDNIREPDPVKKEQLIDNNNIYDFNPIIQNYDDELDKALELSKKEFEFIQDEQEKHVFELIKKEEEDRKNEFKTIKIKLSKILLFDRPNCGKYELILSLIQLYEENCIKEYKSIELEYNDLFKLLKSIRLTNQELESLRKLIVCQSE
jgi:hypothetical protein